MEDSNLTYEISTIKNEMYRVSQSIDNLSNIVLNQQSHINMMTQHINMLVGAINGVNQNMISLQSKLADIEIVISATDDSIKEVVDDQKTLNGELSEIKQAVEAIRFYNQSFMSSMNNNF